MPLQGPEVAEVFRRYGGAYRQQHGATISTAQHRVMTAIELCRTAALGGHLEECDACGHQRIAYNSCRNRHCPKCQAAAARTWLAQRKSQPTLKCSLHKPATETPWPSSQAIAPS